MADPRTFDLGIDTASDEASLALLPTEDDHPVAVERFRPETTMSRELIGTIARFLDTAGIARTEIARIAVTTGPGQYGPLRSGIAVAQGLTLALDIPLAGIGRLEADAALATPAGATNADVTTIIAVHETRTGPAWAAYEVGAGHDTPREIVAPAVTTLDEAARTAPRPATWTGEISDALAELLQDRSDDTIAANPEDSRAVAIVRIARSRNAFGDPAAVDAIYLRPPPITKRPD